MVTISDTPSFIESFWMFLILIPLPLDFRQNLHNRFSQRLHFIFHHYKTRRPRVCQEAYEYLHIAYFGISVETSIKTCTNGLD